MEVEDETIEVGERGGFNPGPGLYRFQPGEKKHQENDFCIC